MADHNHRHTDQPKDYSRTLIMLTVVGFAVMSLALEFFK